MRGDPAGAVPEHAPVALPQQLPSLDGARGLAIALVIAHNLSNIEGTTGLWRVPAVLIDFGWTGVQLFFVLSGFLITRILLQTRTAPHYFQSFYARRALRIFPIYYATLFVLFVLLPAFHAMPEIYRPDYEHQAPFWLYVSNWTAPFSARPSGLPHLWSLAVEEQFYLVWPLIVWRCRPRQVLWVSVLLALVALAFRFGFRATGHDSGEGEAYMFTVSRMDALALGAAAAALTQMPRAWNWIVGQGVRRLWIAAALLFVAGLVVCRGFYPRTSMIGQTLGYSILAVVFTIVIVAAAVSDQLDAAAPAESPHRVLRWRLLRTLGKYSYGLYIIHRPLHDLIARPWMVEHGFLPTSSLSVSVANLVISTAFSLAVAALIYHGFEVHFLALKRYFMPGATRQNLTAVA